MKNLKILILALLFTGCAPTYQLFQTDSQNLQQHGNYMQSENNDVLISYNFWNQDGQSDFLIENKTDNDIYADLSHCHLITNNLAKTYYQNKTTTSSMSLANDVFIKANAKAMSSIEIKEKKIICIPAHSYKKISGYRLLDKTIANQPGTYNQENTPYFYKNIISYSNNKDMKDNKTIEDIFWVKEIHNYTKGQFIKRVTNTATTDGFYYNPISTNITYQLYSPGAFFIIKKL